MYRIMGTYQGKTEELDTAEDWQTAGYLVMEYNLAYGSGWHIFIRRIVE